MINIRLVASIAATAFVASGALFIPAITIAQPAAAPAPAPAATKPAVTAPTATKPAAPAKFDAASALNKAERQPMLAERITKAFSLIGQKVLETRSKRQIAEAAADFQSALKELTATAPTPEIKANYQLLDQLWGEYRAIIIRPATQENLKELSEQNEELVWIATKGANLIEAYVKTPQGDLIAVAGTARILSQRIAKLYLFRSWGLRDNVVVTNDLKTAETEYRAAITRLLAATANTPQIKSELALAETQWQFLKAAIVKLDANRTSKIELEAVAKSCDNITELMERITKLYEGLKA
jgi:hypothetical protein